MSIGKREFMKNKSGSRIGRILSRIINLKSWFDWERMKSFSLFLWNGIKKFFIPQQTTDTESFAAAKKRLNLTDADLNVQKKGLLRVSLLMAVFAVLFFFYAIYHFYNYAFRGGILSLVVMCIALALAFRYHFWYFQIKEHKLGCSLHEWFKRGLMGDKR
jgi:intracellular multiplication protein IcmV